MSDAIDPQESYPIRLAKLQRELAAMQAQRDMLADELKFISTDKIANAADMRYRAHKALGELKGGDHE